MLLKRKTRKPSELSKKIYGYMLATHEHEKQKNFLHVACKACGEKINRSGVLLIPAGLYKCLQPTCDFTKVSKWHKTTDYIKHIAGKDPMKLLEKFKAVDIEASSYKKYLSSVFDEYVPPAHIDVKLPKDAIPINTGTGMLSDSARSYLENRGLDIDNLADEYLVHYVKESKDRFSYYGYIVFPVLSPTGEIIYYQGRDWLNRKTVPRYKNPKQSDFNIGKESVLYNEKALIYADTLFVGTRPC